MPFAIPVTVAPPFLLGGRGTLQRVAGSVGPRVGATPLLGPAAAVGRRA
eukprot:CAMPEP_0182903528 /NCGR_PEP_ID=MMETSP0034_2-20130328/31356_1 /TAXON_ID=156128 /ORGANISM="Nephroselmis pyriformis, Strain CCMP717" /LENGTH=48 /DNA_ID= /DNA_START= /DNA_END= /DNA_ORIENTATION=